MTFGWVLSIDRLPETGISEFKLVELVLHIDELACPSLKDHQKKRATHAQ